MKDYPLVCDWFCRDTPYAIFVLRATISPKPQYRPILNVTFSRHPTTEFLFNNHRLSVKSELKWVNISNVRGFWCNLINLLYSRKETGMLGASFNIMITRLVGTSNFSSESANQYSRVFVHGTKPVHNFF